MCVHTRSQNFFMSIILCINGATTVKIEIVTICMYVIRVNVNEFVMLIIHSFNKQFAMYLNHLKRASG